MSALHREAEAKAARREGREGTRRWPAGRPAAASGAWAAAPWGVKLPSRHFHTRRQEKREKKGEREREGGRGKSGGEIKEKRDEKG